METPELSGLESTFRKTHQWLDDIQAAIGADDTQLAYGAQRAVMHALRDRLPVQEATQLGAQLPMLIRGLYYEGWCPAGKPRKFHRPEFLEAIRLWLPPGPDRLHPEVLARAVLSVIDRHVSAGEVRDVKANLPADLRELWPGGRDSAVTL
ncbi:MAG: DUF2267 domain-containing protein [Mycobacteriales bacterium]